ncbi:tyrosine-protein phosphatase [Cohnella zeiphila]|uniref:Tyrosine-protein phosphatase n=1 Tax=Cohnella zeiphila TaxID=2761120 RepID=A0A7X0VXZ1_9BACL|nr:tyrosine-protein phosphatase [Cohnella zeiphila]MBB6732413.1 tyrosine-protein phosphatase [Cohnella zeiphila]
MSWRRTVTLGAALLTVASPLAGTAAAAGKSAVQATAATAVRQGTFTDAGAERLADGRLVIRWHASADLGPAKVYWSADPEGHWQELARTYAKYNGYVTADPNPGGRVYFLIKGGNGAAVKTAERKLPLKGATNFRDLGGYRTADGKTVKWGKLFRSDELAGLTAADISYLQKSGLKTDVDYRTGSEVKSKPDPTIAGVKYVADPVFSDSDSAGGTDLISYLASGQFDKLGEPGDALIDGNKSMVDSPSAFGKLFDLILDSSTNALVQHCTAGKDRTGIGSALILLALGVPKETVVQDYLLSNVYRAEYNKAAVNAMVSQFKLTDPKAIEIVQALMDVRKEYIEAAFDEMDSKYGSIQGFLEKGLGLTAAEQAKLKRLYLE